MRLRKRIKNSLRNISKIGCYLNFPIISFIILIIFTKKILYRNTNNNKNILILPKSGGREDIYASYIETRNENLIYELPRGEIKNIYNYFIRSEKVKNYRYFHEDNDVILQKKKYFNFLSKIIFYYKKFYKINLIINFNFTYKEEVELARASIFQNIKFLTIHKESQASKGKRLVNEIVYKKSINKYPGSYIAVYNQDEKQTIINSKILHKDKIFVIGCPRIDYSFNIKEKIKDHKNKFTIVYYSIQKGVSLPIYEGVFRTEGLYNIKEFNWLKLAENTEKFLSKYHQESKYESKMIFKTKTGFIDQVERLKKIDTTKIEMIFNNTGHHLLQKADLVVAFNSTTIFEALAANIPVIIPAFDLNDEQKKFVFDLHDTDNVFYASNKNEFKSYINKIKSKFLLGRKNKTQNQLNTLLKHVGNNDGRSGLRLRNLIKEINV